MGSGRVYPLYEQKFRVFLDPWPQYPITTIPSQTGTTATFFAAGTDVGDIGHLKMMAHRITTGGIFTEPFYMIVKLPKYFSLFNNQLGDATDTFCPLSGF